MQLDPELEQKFKEKASSSYNEFRDYVSKFISINNDEIKLLYLNLKDSIELLVDIQTPKFLKDTGLFEEDEHSKISILRDPEGQLAKAAARGSSIVRLKRSEKERRKKDRSILSNSNFDSLLGQNDYVEIEVDQDEELFEKIDIESQRKLLPCYESRDDFLKVVKDNQVLVVVGETGSGKTTQLTQYLYEEGYSKIVCTQPRRVAAISVARRVAEETNSELGSLVGYSIRFEDCTNENTRIIYMTEGILLRESLTCKDLDKYNVIIIDEAHERSLNTDILLGMLKALLRNRLDLKIIICSATMDATKFSEFFGKAPIFSITGRTFPVDILYLKSNPEDYVVAAVKQVVQIHIQSDPGDILVFLSGQEDILIAAELIKEKLDDIVVLPIYSQMPVEQQQRIFSHYRNRKCILATNIAETSLTVEGIVYVIDTGYCKLKVYNSKIGIDALQLTLISQANASQRSGRAGRVRPGKAYRLYTESSFKYEMYKNQIPEIQRCNLSGCLLTLKSMGVKDIFDFEFLDRPPEQSILVSLYDLYRLEALDDLGNLTKIGKQMSYLPIEPSLAKSLIESTKLGCSVEMATIIAMLSVPTVFYRPKERQEEADSKREKLSVSEGDHLTLLNVFNLWKLYKFSENWASKHFLNTRSLQRAKEVRDQLITILQKNYSEPKTCGFEYDQVRKALCSGYFHQVAKSKGLGGKFNLVKTGLEVSLYPTSSLIGNGIMPHYVIYHELILSTKEYMNYVTSVEASWLFEYSNGFYKLPGIENKNKRERQNEDLQELQPITEFEPKKFEGALASRLKKPRRRRV